MKYFLDQEFHEYFRKPLFGKNFHTIELISIGLVAENGKQYYAISKDFDIKAAWNSYQMKQVYGDMRNIYPEGMKEYWLRNNVLKPIFKELWYEKCHMMNLHHCTNDFTYSNFSTLVTLYGKTNQQIAQEIKEFVHIVPRKPQFYGYYADYDWVVFCSSLFGKMINLPEGFPMYCNDLKQMLDEKVVSMSLIDWSEAGLSEDDLINLRFATFDEKIKMLKQKGDYPKQENEHSALADAQWNKKLHEYLQTI